MVGSFSRNTLRSADGSLISNWFKRSERHPDAFECGVRVTFGAIAGEGERWRYRSTAVDRLVLNDVRNVDHGPIVLRIAVDSTTLSFAGGKGVRPGNVVICAHEVQAGAELELTFPPVELEHFGISVV